MVLTSPLSCELATREGRREGGEGRKGEGGGERVYSKVVTTKMVDFFSTLNNTIFVHILIGTLSSATKVFWGLLYASC